MLRLFVIIALAVTLGVTIGVAPASAQVPAGGYYHDGAYYVPEAGAAPAPTTYWPTNNETAYNYGPYAFAPGYGPYLRLGGEGGWNPNIGSTYNAYPPGDYYTDYGFPYYAVATRGPFVVRSYYGVPYAAGYYSRWYPFVR
jgi:hypothetical protein